MAESELILLRRFAANGDAEAFAEIVKQHASLVYGVSLRILEDKDIASDIVQETFLQLVCDATQITDSLPNWLHRTATNRAIDFIRQKSQRKKREFNYAASQESISSEDEKAAWREISIYIDEEIENLDDQTREVIILRFFECLSTNDIAEKCGISQTTVYRWMESGIELLRLKLKSRGVIVPAAMFMFLLSENIVKAVPASILKELGKIAMAGSKVTIGAKIVSSISAGIAIKTKIMAGILIVLLGAGLTVVFSFIANGEDKPGSTWELITKSLRKESQPESGTNNKAIELLAKYTETRNKFNSFTSITENTMEFEVNPTRSGARFEDSHLKNYNKIDFRYDGTSVIRRERLWGDINTAFINVPENDPQYRSIYYDDNVHNMIRYLKGNNNDIGRVDIDTQLEQKLAEQTLARGYKGHEVLGYLIGDDERFDFVIKNMAKDVSVRDKTENISGSQCYVIDANTTKGKYAIWLDPIHGYNVAKAEVTRNGGNLRNGYEPPIKKGDKEYTSVSNVQFRQFDGTWVPVEADIYYSWDLTSEFGYKYWEKIHHKVTDFKINPDHKALGSFKPNDIPNSAKVAIIQAFPKLYEYTWKDGKIWDSDGNEVVLDDIKTPSLVGKSMPDLEGLHLILDPEVIENKRLLVCFCDTEQDSSRNVILKLNKAARNLLDKNDVYIAFILVGNMEEQAFRVWLNENKIIKAAAVSHTIPSVLRYNWYVQSLPWLILTDENHIVTDEGFSIAELDEKITTLSKK